MNLVTKYFHRRGKETYGYQGDKGGINWDTGIDIYILLYIKQIINKKEPTVQHRNSTQ